MVRIAFTKGRIEDKAIEIFEKSGYNCEELKNKGRKLFFDIGNEVEVVLAKANDVITYVEHGVCDAGIVGKDPIMGGFGHKVVASKYPKVAKEYFSSIGMDVEIVKIDGSVELAPLLGLADGIVDIVETGSTLKENGLEVVAEIAPVSARLIVNTASMKLKKNELDKIIEALGGGEA